MMENGRTLAICSKAVIFCSAFVGTRGLAQQLIDGDFLVMRNGAVQAGLSVLAVINPNEMIVTQVIQGDGELRLLISDSRSIAMQDAEILGILVGVIRRF